ncbi:uncharacterized protein LOC112494424 [Cephus cinctus]|uniref:Uncharacterized protein LOC112494424 n=1 Tax=Cephus cinctus TaxID=211228 RepID=A0AAJ7W1V4_CEPCN|nr:uncharacterized protein LOC112494424 [Cephus cinctus]
MAGNNIGILCDEKNTLDPNIAKKDGGFILMGAINTNEVSEGSICTINPIYSTIATEQRITDEMNIKKEHLKIPLTNEVSKNEANNRVNKGTHVLNAENTESNKCSDKKELGYNNNFSINALDDVKKIDTISECCTIQSTSVNSNLAQDSLFMDSVTNCQLLKKQTHLEVRLKYVMSKDKP